MSTRTWLRSHRTGATLVGCVLGVLVALTLFAARSDVRGGALDPDNPRPGGARAVARVIAAHGVDVDVVRRAAELGGAGVDEDTTVVVTSTEQLGRRTAAQLDRVVRSAGAVVVADPAALVVAALDLPLEVRDARVGDRSDARCADPLLADLTVHVDATTGYRAAPGRGVATVACFPGAGPDPAALVLRIDRGVPTYAVAGTDVLTNEHVATADNAAVALRLLGQHDRLLWYVPDSRDVGAGEAGPITAQLPRGLVPGLWLVGAATLCTMLWRARRLGPLVVEPLPVVVKAVESTQGRGRLYRRVRDRQHAAAILRDATRRRLTARLRLPATDDPETLVRAAAAASGRAPDAVRALLTTAPVPDDTALIRLADALATLEREVHTP